MTRCDAAGSTPIHRAAANGLSWAIEYLLEVANFKGHVAATCHAPWTGPKSFSQRLLWNQISTANDFSFEFQLPHTPVHAAMIHGHFDCAKLLIEKGHKGDMHMPYGVMDEKLVNIVRTHQKARRRTFWTGWGKKFSGWIEWDIVELACLLEAPTHFIGFLIDYFKVDLTKAQHQAQLPYLSAWDILQDPPILRHLWHPLHLVASSGNYDLLNYFIGDLKCNPFVEDFEGNTALHHAMKVTV